MATCESRIARGVFVFFCDSSALIFSPRSLTHYKLYLVSKVAAKIRGDDDLEPENFRGEGGPQTSKKKKERCLSFSENEFEVLYEC